MTTEEFNQVIKRHVTLKEYSQAFAICVNSLINGTQGDVAAETARKLIKDHSYNVMKQDGSKRVLTVPLHLTLEWIIDTAIALGYKTLDRGSVSTGVFSSVPCVVLGNMLSKQKFGIKENKDGSCTLVYTFGFSSDFKLINALLTSIIDGLSTHNY